MTIQLITYHGRDVAAATRSRFFLADALRQRPAGDSELTFVLFMCAYAADVLCGVLPGPYSDENARRYARACLIPTELLERPALDVERAAQALQIPTDELRSARAEQQRSALSGSRREAVRYGPRTTATSIRLTPISSFRSGPIDKAGAYAGHACPRHDLRSATCHLRSIPSRSNSRQSGCSSSGCR